MDPPMITGSLICGYLPSDVGNSPRIAFKCNLRSQYEAASPGGVITGEHLGVR